MPVNNEHLSDTDSSTGPINRAASILDVVRGINRGVVRGVDSTTLFASAFEKLISMQILSTAWLYLYKNEPEESNNVACGLGDSFDALVEKMNQGWLPNCCRRTLAEHCIVSNHPPIDTCSECPLKIAYSQDEKPPEEALTSTIEMDGSILGFICVSVAPHTSTTEERLFWIKELADDIAFALRSIELSREHKKAEQALQKEALRRQVLMGASGDGICIINQNHEVIEANQRFAQMIGRTPQEVLTLYTWDFEAVASEAQIRESFADLTRTSVTFETKHRRKDGTLYDAEVSASGAMVGGEALVFTVSRDITEKKKLQASLVQSDRLASMGLLAAGVAHEINNPLAYVLLNLEGLIEDVPSVIKRFLSPPSTKSTLEEHWIPSVEANRLSDVENRLNEALSGARRIQRITRSLGTFSRVDKDKVVPVNVPYVLECAVNMAFNEIKYRAQLITDYSPVSSVLADEGSISQVFLNLLINAAHAIGEGNVADNEIRVSTREGENSVYIEVQDTGSGIAQKDLDNIFEPFFSTKKIGVGSGLGLAISKNIISSYGGTITVESEIGKGSTFRITLPKNTLVAPEVPPVIKQKTGVPSIGKILIVDDEEGICRALVRVLRGNDIVTARHGNDAKAIIQTGREFDLILCDMMMPGVTGMDLHQWLLYNYPALATRVVFITGGAFTPNAQAYLKRVDNLCINKPFDVPELQSKISTLISQFRK